MLRTLTDDQLKEHSIPMDARSWAPEPVRKWFFENSEPFLFNGGGYQTLNFIPSIGTTLLGILCGQLLLSTAGKGRKLGLLLVGGAICLALGLVMGEFACPIVKRIWTPSWVLFSGGYVIWMLALFYFLFDVLPLKVLAFPLAILGMNSLAVYLMGELLRSWTRQKVVEIHLSGVLESIFGAEKLQADMFGPIIFPAVTVLMFWLVCLWMYRRKIFVRL
jgi:predicted acyltransferase